MPGISKNSQSRSKRANRSLHRETVGACEHRYPPSIAACDGGCGPRDRMTEAEHFRQRLHQPVAADRPVSTRIEQSLEVAFEVRQADLAATVEGLSSRQTTQVPRVKIRDDGTGQRLPE